MSFNQRSFQDAVLCKSSESSSSRSRSPQSETRTSIIKQGDPGWSSCPLFSLVSEYYWVCLAIKGGASHWSLTCKASDSSPSVSPSQNNNSSSRGSAEAAHFHSLHISPLKTPKREPTGGHWPAREASSYDSGKGTLSAKASSSSESESDGRRSRSPAGIPRLSQNTMPTLKRALEAPPVTRMPSPTLGSVREKHRAVASLLERGSSHPLPGSSRAQEGARNNIWSVFPQHAAAFWLSSRAAALNGGGLLSPMDGGIYQPATAAISPAHSNGLSYSPQAESVEDEQPLNLSKKPKSSA